MLPPLCPNRKEHAHMTLRRHASPRAPSKRGKGQRSTTAVPFLFTPPAPSVQGRARAHDIAPFHFTPPAPAKWGRAAFTACRAVRLYHACAIHAGKGVFTWHCYISPRPAHSVRAWKGWKRCQQIRGCSRAHCPSRKEHAHMTLCRHALPRQFRPSEAGAAFTACRAFTRLPYPRCPSRKGRVHMMLSLTLQHTAPFVRAGQCSPAVAPSYVTSSASFARGRAWLAPLPGTFKARVFCAGFAKILFNFSPGVRLPHPVKIISIIGRSNLV